MEGYASDLVLTGKGGRDKAYKAKPTVVRRDILSAARWIAGAA